VKDFRPEMGIEIFRAATLLRAMPHPMGERGENPGKVVPKTGMHLIHEHPPSTGNRSVHDIPFPPSVTVPEERGSASPSVNHTPI
jgi:hypothetical protein